MFLQKFIDYISLEKNYSSHTILAYENDLKNFSVFFLNEHNVSSIEKVEYYMIRSWVISLIEEGKSNRSINRKLSTLRSFYKFLMKTSTIEVSPMSEHKPLKIDKKIHIPFSEEEIFSVLKGDKPTNSLPLFFRLTDFDTTVETFKRVLISSKYSFGYFIIYSIAL